MTLVILFLLWWSGALATAEHLPHYEHEPRESSESNIWFNASAFDSGPGGPLDLYDNATRAALRELLTDPTGSRAESITISIPSLPVEVRLNDTETFLYLGSGVKYTPQEGMRLMDRNGEEFSFAEREFEKEFQRLGYKKREERFCTIVVHEKVFPRRFLRVKPLRPRNPNGVDFDVSADLHELAVYLDNYMQYLDTLGSELKQWYYHTSIVFRSITDSVLKMYTVRNHISLMRPISRRIYPPLNGETLVWLDIARITVFCGVDGLQTFWSMLRETPNKRVDDSFEQRRNDSRWKSLLDFCCVSSFTGLNRILFRRPYASLNNNIPGIVSMFRVEGSTIENAVPPTLRDIARSDD